MRLGAALLALAAVVSLAASPDRRTSLPYVVQALLGAGCLLAVAGRPARAVRRLATPDRLITAFVGLGYVALVGILLSTRWPAYKLSFLSGVYAALPSIRSLPISLLAQGLTPNQAGGLMAGFTAVAVAITLDPGRLLRSSATDATEDAVSHRRRVSAGVLTICGVMVVFMTGSRAALAAVGVATLVMLILRTRRWLLLPAGGAVIAVALAIFRPGLPGSLFAIFLRDETVETKLVARLDIWRSVLGAIQDHVFTGIGLGVLNQVLPFRYPYETVGLSFTVTHAHDVYLDTALTLGIFGLVGLMLLLAGIVYTALAVPDGLFATRNYARAMLAATVVFMIFGITDALSLSTPSSIVLWVWAITLSLVIPYARPVPPGCANEHAMLHFNKE